MKPKTFAILIFLALSSLPGLANKNLETQNLTAGQILEKVYGQNFSKNKSRFSSSEITMAIHRGDYARTRVFEIKTMQDKNNPKIISYMAKFLSPKGIKGSAFLTKGQASGMAEQYMYLPAVNKLPKKVSAGNALSSFFGSDFTYGDIMPVSEDMAKKAILTKLPDTEYEKQRVYQIEVDPNISGSPYGKIILLIKQGDFVPLKVDYYGNSEAKSSLIKTMKVLRLSKIGEKLVPTKIRMLNQKTRGFTVLDIGKINSDAKLSSNDFTEQAMTRP